VNNVDLLDMGQVVTKKNSTTSLSKNEVPFINNSEKEDNAIFSHQLKQFNHARSNTQDKSPLIEGQERHLEGTQQHVKSAFSKEGSKTER
jgi:hypothetical protein